MKYQPLKLNVAQQMLVAMGLDDLRLSAHHVERNESATKSGPGRKHKQGLTQGRVHPAKGDWLGRHAASNEKRERRLIVANIGRRQAIKFAKHAKLAARLSADLNAAAV